MEQFNRKIEEIRSEMENMKSEKYALVNPVLKALDEYVRNLYIRVLCTVVQYENEPSEMQELYLKRIISGMGVEDPLEEHMRRALEISDVDMREFIKIMLDSDAGIKYYFALEGLLLEAMGDPGRANYEYLALIMELCDISKRDLEYLCAVAGSVLKQESALFDQAGQLAGENTGQLNFRPYVSSYYAGAIVNTDTEKYYIAPNIQNSAGVVLQTEYNERTVTFENLMISIDGQWDFNGCEEVVFRNCRLTGGSHFIRLESVRCVRIEKCRFTGFSDGVFECHLVNHMTICESEFTDCGRTAPGDSRGGVIRAHEGSFDLIRICDSKFHGCYIAAGRLRYNYGVTGVVFGFDTNPYVGSVKKLVVTGNEFSGCDCINNGNYRAAIFGVPSDNQVGDREACDNQLWGKVTTLFEWE